MVWSKWKGAIALAVTGAGLAWAGFAWTQQPGVQIVPEDKILTYQVQGKSEPQRGVILKQWRTPDGCTAYEVQNTDTNQITRVVKTTPDAALRSTAPRANTSIVKPLPTGGVTGGTTFTGQYQDLSRSDVLPVSYQEAAPLTMDATPMPLPQGTPLPVSPAFAVGKLRTIQESGKPAVKALIIASWRMADGMQAAQCEIVGSGEKLTLVETGSAPAGVNQKSKAMAMRIVHWGDSQTSPVGTPQPPGEKQAEVAPMPSAMPSTTPPASPQIEGWPTTASSGGDECGCDCQNGCGAECCPPRFGIFDRIVSFFTGHRESAPAMEMAEPSTMGMTPLPPLPDSTAGPAIQPAPPTDYRASWGADPKPNTLPDTKVSVPTDVVKTIMPSATLPITTSTPKTDPLTAPLPYASPKAEDKLAQFTPSLPSGSSPLAPTTGKAPLGAQSVMAASNGMPPSGYQYLPVPVVTTPQPKAPPLPPVPQMPQAPQLNQYVNAFTPPADPNAPPQQMGMMPANPYQRGMMPGQMPMDPRLAAMYQRPPMMPPAYDPRTGMPLTYQGPMPPNPSMQQPMPQRPMMAANGTGWSPVSYNPAMDRRNVAPAMNAAQFDTAGKLQEALMVLKTSLYPAQREWAANNLAMFDYRAHPEALMALVVAAKEDPAATVRAGCVATMARMNANVEPVVATLNGLRNDTDPRVRLEVTTALAHLAPQGAPTGPAPGAPQTATQPQVPPLPPMPGAAMQPVLPAAGRQ